MIRSLDDDVTAFPHYDLCIVGSGPAGITVCAEVMEAGWRVAFWKAELRQKRNSPIPCARSSLMASRYRPIPGSEFQNEGKTCRAASQFSGCHLEWPSSPPRVQCVRVSAIGIVQPSEQYEEDKQQKRAHTRQQTCHDGTLPWRPSPAHT
jgi:hypothetical protein